MELLQLRYFQVVARLEHMTKAAAELSVSQPSLSKTIRLLEQELGTELFERKSKYIKLNEAGKVFLKHIDKALSALKDAELQLHAMKNNGCQRISLAFFAGSPMLPELLSGFNDIYPDVNFQLMQRLTSSKPDFDICISALPLHIEGIKSMPLLTEEIFLAVPNHHPLANKKEISLQEASSEGFIQLKSGNALRELCDNFCKMAGFTPHVLYESDDPSTVRGLIKIGQGVGFIPAISWGGTTGSSVTLLKIKDPVCTRTIGLSWIEDRYHSNIVNAFRDYTIKFFEELTK